MDFKQTKGLTNKAGGSLIKSRSKRLAEIEPVWVYAADSATRLYIDGIWTADEFGTLFRYLDDIYSMVLLFSEGRVEKKSLAGAKAPLHRSHLRRLMLEMRAQPLRVHRISYASPGSLDIMGAGKLADVVKETTFGIADRFLQSEDRKLARDHNRLENEGLGDENQRAGENFREVSARDAQFHELEVEKRRLENRKKEEEVRAQELANMLTEVDIVKRVVETCRLAGFTDEQVNHVVKSLVNKVRPIVQLIGEDKLLPVPPE